MPSDGGRWGGPFLFISGCVLDSFVAEHFPFSAYYLVARDVSESRRMGARVGGLARWWGSEEERKLVFLTQTISLVTTDKSASLLMNHFPGI